MKRVFKLKLLKILGWIFVPFIMIFVQWKKLKKPARVIGIIWAAFFLIGVISNPDSEEGKTASPPTNNAEEVEVESVKVSEENPKVETTASAEDSAKELADKAAKEKADAEAKAAAAEQQKKNQQSVLDFEKSVYALEGTVKPIMDNYQKVITAVSEGNATIYDAYDAATAAKKAAEHLQLEFSSLNAPKELPKDVKELLDDATNDLSTAYYTKKKAFDYVLKFLDDQKPSTMQKFKDESSMSDSFIMSGVAKILDAKTKMGIDITATK